MNKKVKISKLDAAKRQLETAVRLYFNCADPVSIHTLAGAAHGIISDLNKKYGGRPMLMSSFPIKDQYKSMVRKKIREAGNFLKHADEDPEKVIDFNPDQTEMFIFDACSKYQELTGESVSYLGIYLAWFASRNIEVFNYPAEKKKLISSINTDCQGNRGKYFSNMLVTSSKLI